MPVFVVTSLGDSEKDVAIDVTVTSSFNVKRTTVVMPLTAAKKGGGQQKEEEVPGNLQRCWTAFLSFCY